MTGSRPSQTRSLSGPFGVAVALHITVAALLIFANAGHGGDMPPPVRLILRAAPAGERAIGAVNPEKAAPEAPIKPKAREAPAPTKTVRKPPPKAPKTTAAVPKPETPQPKTTAAPKAGGGPVGGKGSDVTNLKMEEGVDFPYPQYLHNLVNVVLQNFKWEGTQPWTADVKFLIKRDGSVVGMQLLKSNGSYAFRVEAQGAIEAAGRSGRLGKLPDGFADDVLSIVFTFDPKILSQR